ncbi:ribosome-binding protein 1a isoform X1 [Dunckerocampus dactyliophorus]|uniref:ribosome-binding protein 1a isoform X1 n=1 Tax=Dunckerocampus dactyliophorus TaxID=161453 RepID=UPI0024057EDE|nr:ribosome-binding protein 1a isoform X1 [Dunckerocampus dactyliophorus]
MDIYDPQTLGIMVFGGFMVISVVGIALVSTFSMKETSYEEVLAKQRRELGNIQSSRTEKKKKDKTADKKNRGKKKDEKPNGMIPESGKTDETSQADLVPEPVAAPIVATAPAPAPESVPAPEVKPNATPAPADRQPKAAEPTPTPAQPSPVPSLKDKKKKKSVRTESDKISSPLAAAPVPVKHSPAPALVQTKTMAAPSTASGPAKASPASAKSSPASTSNKSASSSSKSAPPSAKSAPPSTKSASAPAKSAPAPNKSAAAADKSAPASPKSASASDKSAPAPNKSATAAAKSAPAPAKSAPAPAKSAPAPAKSAPAPAKSAPAPDKTAPAPNKSVAPADKSAPPPSKSAPPSAKSTSVPSKSSAAPTKASAAQTKSSASTKSTPPLGAETKDVPIMVVPPVGSAQTTTAAPKSQDPKKKASKKKSEILTAVDSSEAPLHLPYKVLVSTISSMVFSEAETHRLIEMLSEKAGIIQDTWHKATQKGDPVAMLKKQLEEKEKQLTAEQEDSSAAKNRVRDLTKELSAEKSKVASVETRLSSQLSKREQEMIALQARMQASYQDHVAQTQKLNAKILGLQDQLEKGPNAQLARLQQENSILRDALNQATSQAESKQNAALAKLHQECAKLTKELGEKTEILHADEHMKKGLEAKVSATEKQLSALQASHAESEQALQRKLEEVCEELRTTQTLNNNLQDSLKKAQQDSGALSGFEVRMGNLQAEVKERSAQVDALKAQLEESRVEKQQLVQQLTSINSLLEAGQNKKEQAPDQGNAAELQQLKLSLQERDSQLTALHEELKQLQMKKEAAENTISELEQRNKSEDSSLIASLQDELKNLKEETVQLKNTAKSNGSMEQIKSSLTEKEALVTSLQEQLREAKQNEAVTVQLTAFQSEAKESLQKLFPLVPLETAQPNWLQAFTQKAQEVLNQQESQQSHSSQTSPELLEKLKEADESHSSLQAECEQYRTVLAETEGMLKHLQKSVEEEELVWKSKMATSEEQLRAALEKVNKMESEKQNVEQLKEQMMLLEAQLEKQSDNHCIAEEMEQLRLQLSDSQSQLGLARKEAQAQKEELSKVREQLSQITMSGQREQNGPTEAHPSQVVSKLDQTTEKLEGEATERQKLSEEFEQAQATITELQAQLDLLKASAESPQGDAEDVAQLKERLEKEKKLSKDLGQAATKLQQLLKATQEQLTKERETVITLQEHLDGKGEYVELKEGTSV